MSLPSALGPSWVGHRVVVRRRVPGERGPSGGPALTDATGVLVGWGASTLTLRLDDGADLVVDRALVVAGKPVPPRPSTRLRVGVAEAERRALDTWPALETEQRGDWVLRASAGFSARANSALLLGDPDEPWPEALRGVEEFYRRRSLPCWVQAMSGSPELAALEAAGWVSARPGEGPTVFQLAGVSRVRRALRSPSAGSASGSGSGPATVALRDRLDEAWLADDERARAHREAATGVLEGPAQVAFAAVREGDGPSAVVAKGRGALTGDGTWLGVTDVWVSPSHRRAGLARRVLAALVSWGAEAGATTVFLQVREDNGAARRLYAALGFEDHHSYRYLTPPAR